jgi:HEPN domain-containing protein
MESPGHDCGCFKRMYNEEEVLEIIRQYALEEHLITSSKPDIWFKQYKKK